MSRWWIAMSSAVRPRTHHYFATVFDCSDLVLDIYGEDPVAVRVWSDRLLQLCLRLNRYGSHDSYLITEGACTT